ncbi:MAG: PhoH family protein [Erysipelotrichia bacterium]|nr:PhoH family protein [Erysipelotrichia bacterium]
MTDQRAMSLCGSEDRNLRIISEFFGIEISSRENCFMIAECNETVFPKIQNVLIALYEVARRNQPVTEQDTIYACRLAAKNEKIQLDDLSSVVIGRTLTGKAVCPKTRGQMEFVKAMDAYSIVFAIGPAGTGKTYLAVIKAVSMMKKGEIKRIVLTRPAVEAGESLGFLPGDLKEKVDPYLTPLYDALHDMLGVEQTDKLIEKEAIEIAPLAYMRGRTLDDSFVILDEAQNTTPAQMKMFLTRLGFNSRMVITGDVTQIDLKFGAGSGLIEASDLLKGINEIKIMELTSDDVVRHPLVQKIIERYAEKDSLAAAARHRKSE